MDEIRNAKRVAHQLVIGIAPGEEDVVDEGFEKLAAVDFEPPQKDPSHAFDVSDVWPTALLISGIIGSIFRDAIKDVLKERIKGLLLRWLEPEQPLSGDEIDEIARAIETEGIRLGIANSKRTELASAARDLLNRCPSAVLVGQDK